MNVLVDPDTGEMVEVLDQDTYGAQAYDLPTFKRAVMSQTREKRAVLAEHAAAVDAKAEAEANYRQVLAVHVLKAKEEHGATVAEQAAKGQPPVVEARQKMLAAEGMERNAFERLRLCSEDRASLHRLGEWSAQQERYAGGEQT